MSLALSVCMYASHPRATTFQFTVQKSGEIEVHMKIKFRSGFKVRFRVRFRARFQRLQGRLIDADCKENFKKIRGPSMNHLFSSLAVHLVHHFAKQSSAPFKWQGYSKGVKPGLLHLLYVSVNRSTSCCDHLLIEFPTKSSTEINWDLERWHSRATGLLTHYDLT